MPPTKVRDDSPPAATRPVRFGASRRLRRPADFAAVLAAPRTHAFRAARHWLSMTAAWTSSDAPAVRFGATVGKRNARRAVDRALVKRILREAGRRAVPTLESVCAERGVRLDIAFRLKAPRAAADAPSSTVWRRILRAEAEWLLDRLAHRLAHRLAEAPA